MENLSKVHLGLGNDAVALLKQILATHGGHDEQGIDCNSILKKAEEIFTLAMAEANRLGETSVETEGTASTEEEEFHEDYNSEFAKHSDIINRLSIEIANPGGVDAHQMTISVLTILSKYTFEAKLTLSIAALSLNYGQCFLLMEVYLSDKIPQQMAMLKGTSDISQQLGKIKPWLDNLNDLVLSSILELAKTIFKLAELLSICSSTYPREVSVAKDTIPIATYWGIRGVITAAAQVNSMDFEKITSVAEQWEIASLAHKIKNVKQILEAQIDIFQKHMVVKITPEPFIARTILHETAHIDNMKVLKTLVKKKDEPPKTSVIPEALRGKTVLLVMSGLDIAEDPDFALLHETYEESRTHDTSAESQYEVVWLPVPESLDKWTHDMNTMFESNRSRMTWTVVDPSKIDPAVIKTMMERFHYQGHVIVAVLDTNHKVVNKDAIDMIWTWGNFAFPFTKAREEYLWRGEILAPVLIVNGFDTEVENWVKEGKYIVMYGGDDVEWISKFLTTTIEARQLRNIPLEMIYIGKNNENVGETNRSISWIKDKGTGHYLPNSDMVRLFWNRIEHMKRSRVRVGNSSGGEDKVLQGIMKMLSYGQWGSLFKGQELIATGNGDSMLLAMKRYCEKMEENANMSFGEAFKGYFDNIMGTPVVRIILPGVHDTPFLNRVVCTECNRIMEKFIMFRCTHGSE